MRTTLCDFRMDAVLFWEHQCLPPSCDHEESSILIYSRNMELCLGLQIAFEDNFVIRSTTDLEMLFPMIAAFEPQWVIIDELPTLKMQRTIAALRKRWPKLHILFFIPDRSFPRAQTQNILSNVDAVLYEPIAIAELKDLVSRLSANEHRLDQELLTTHLTLRQN